MLGSAIKSCGAGATLRGNDYLHAVLGEIAG